MALSTKTQIEQKLKKEKRFDKIIGRKDVTEGLTEAQVNALIAQYLIDNPVESTMKAFIPESTTRAVIGGSTTGDILAPTPAPTGKYYKILQLNTGTSTEQSGIDVRVDGNLLGLDFLGPLGGTTPTNGYIINSGSPTSVSFSTIEPFYAKDFEIVALSSRSRTIRCVYQLGSFQ